MSVAERQRRWRENHPQENASRSKSYRAQYRSTHKGSISLSTIKRKYGLTADQLEEMKKSQDGKCAICDQPFDVVNVDHDHKTNEVRGLLCRKCNWGLGQFRDSLELLRKAAEYLGQ